MRQVFLDKSEMIVKDVAQPLIDDHSVLVRLHYAFVSSGTHLKEITHEQEGLFKNFPHKVKKILDSVTKNGGQETTALMKNQLKNEFSTIGYACSGRVIAIGKKVKKLAAGDWVACAGVRYAHCEDFIVVPEHLAVKVKKQEHLKAASITTIGAIALQGVRRAQLEIGGIVAVIGLGLLGQLTVQLAKLSGCYVVGIDFIPERLAIARELGADAVYHATSDNVQQEIAMLSQHHGVDVTIITASCKDSVPICEAMEMTRKKGRVVIVGDIGLNIERDEFYKKEIDLVTSCSYGPGRYDSDYEVFGKDYPYAYVRWTENRNMQSFVDFIEQKKIKVEPLIFAEVVLSDIKNMYEMVSGKKALGILLKYEIKDEQKKEEHFLAAKKLSHTYEAAYAFVYPKKNKLRIGIIGAGDFTKKTLLPIISGLKNTQIGAIVDADLGNSVEVSQLYRGAHALTSDTELFENNLVDAVVIASPQQFYGAHVFKALQHGKAVFMTQPLATDFQQLQQLQSFFSKNKTVPLCVDYSRSFSPFIQKIKTVTQERRTPLMMHYRINGNIISKNNWIQTNSATGSIIGQACQIFDLFCYITDAKPVVISAEGLRSSRDDVFPTDNFSVQVSFDDGSLCSLLYTALGHSGLGRERMELFFDGKSVVMDDYTRLFGFGLSSWFNETVSEPDRGHGALMEAFFSGLKSKNFVSPVDVKRICMISELTLQVDKLVCEGGGVKEVKW